MVELHEQVDLVGLESLALGADCEVVVQGGHTLNKLGRHAELPQLRLDGVGCDRVLNHDRASLDDNCLGGLVASSGVVGLSIILEPVDHNIGC